ncbi:MAG: FkbM family methyltransferase [Gemmatimonadota bacterium]
MKHTARSWLLNAGVYVSRYRHEDKVRALVRAMRPRHDQGALVRIGAEADGGYLVPDELQGIEAVFSPGVDDKITFEIAMAERGARSHLLDASIDAVPPGLTDFTFDRRYLGPRDEGDHITLGTWFRDHASLADQNDYLLQMDIEGAEYAVLQSTPAEILRKFRIIIVEFHHFHELFHPIVYETVSDAVYNLLSLFEVAHIHPNNGGYCIGRGSLKIPSLIEVTFVRRDWLREAGSQPLFPHALDRKCVSDRPELPLPRCWYS